MVFAAGSRHSLNYEQEATFGEAPPTPAYQVSTVTPGGVVEIGDIFSILDENAAVLVAFTATAGTVANVVAGLETLWIASTNATCLKYTALDVGTTHLTLTGDGLGVWEDFSVTAVDGGGLDTQTMTVTHVPTADAMPIPTELRHTGTTLTLAKDTFTSEEIRSDRQITDLRHGNKRGEGDVSFELSYGAFDDLLEAVLQGTWNANVLKAGTTLRSFRLARVFDDVKEMIVYSGCVFNSLSLSIPINAMVTGTLGIVGQTGEPEVHVMTLTPINPEVGDVFNILDPDGNVLATFTAAAATVANVVAGLEVAWNAATDAISIKYTAADVGTTHLTLTGDAAGDWYALGTSTVQGGANNFQSLELVHTPVGVATAAAVGHPFDSFTGVIEEGGVAIATVTGIEMSLDNGIDPAYVLMNPETPQMINGRSNITGTVTAHFDDAALLTKFISETETKLLFTLTDVDVASLKFELNNVKYTGADIPTPGEDAIILSLPFQALYTVADVSNIKVTRTP